MDRFDSEKSNVGDFFGKKDVIYRVPSYQREYSWGEENIDALLEDLFSGDSYFFGAFVLNSENYKKEGFKDIVDGQQRILTISIFFSILRDLFLELKDKQKSNQIQTKYISNKDDDANDEFKVITSNSSKSFFEKYIQKENNKIEESRPETTEEELIVKNYIQIKAKVLEKLNKLDSNIDKIKELQNIRESLKDLEIIIIEVGSEDDAFTFFETLNSRGMDLSQADLIKNLIFKNTKKDNKEIELEWNKIKESIIFNDTVDITQFIRHLWLSTRLKVTEKNLFRVIKKTININNYENLLNELIQEAEFYRMIINPSPNDWENSELNVFKALKKISVLNVQQSRSILLTLIRIIKDKDFWENNKTKKIYETINLIEKFTFSFSTVSKKSPSALEGIYSKYSIKLNNEYIKKNKNSKANIEKILEEFKDKIKELYPSENTFKEGFIKIEYKKSSKQIALIKYILEKINYSGNVEQVFDHVTIEHILPQTPEAGWNLSQEEIQSYVNKIGNLLPLGPEYNRDASNKTILEKIPMYNQSKIEMTCDFVGEIKKRKGWSENKIIERTNKLADLAWPLWKI